MTETNTVPRRRGRPATGADGGADVQSLDRAVSLLRVLSEADGLSLTEIVRRTELPTSTTHRLLHTLEKRRLVAHDPASGLWTIGVGLFSIGAAYLRIRKLPEIGRPVLRRLLQETGETVNLAMFDGTELVVVAQAEGHAPLRAFFRLGSRLPLHATAAGKSVLAAAGPGFRASCLERIAFDTFTPRTHEDSRTLMADVTAAAARGFALDDEEHAPGMRAVAAAILNEWGEPVGALSIFAPTARMDAGKVEDFATRVRAAAAEMTRLYAGATERGG